ncbi:MAG: UDP-N-acetylmuramoyl-tripeptide--D-alanyl-D-alanine ligase [Candidatus Azotimanducaceae bacterium]|jgi:UDP-N-acetylmuramoyl-tripeptide--D-alanyl-D-alanine ligase
MKNFLKSITVTILTWEATLLLKRTKPKIVAVTGNVGKTSTKDAIYTVLKDHMYTRKSEKGFNTDIGVPLTVLGLRNGWNNPLRWAKNLIDGLIIVLHPGEYPEVLVLEMGVDHPGDMEKLAAWIKPDVVVITRLPDVPVHVENFATPDDVIKEKLQLLHALKPDGVFVFNNDDPKVQKAAESIRQQSIGFSRYSLSHFSASSDEAVYDGGVPVGLEFELTHLETTASMYVSGSLGVQHAYNYAAAVAVGSVFGIDLIEATKNLREHVPPPGRMRIVKGIKDTLIIDDTYNSSPTATERALQTIKELKGVKRKIAVLGDMLELGQFSVREHEKVGEDVANSVDMLVTVGIRARKIAEAAMEFGMSEKHIYQYDDINRARKEIKNMIQPGDVILAKASQGIRAEMLVAEIMFEDERRSELLVRQDPAWQEKKVTSLV